MLRLVQMQKSRCQSNGKESHSQNVNGQTDFKWILGASGRHSFLNDSLLLLAFDRHSISLIRWSVWQRFSIPTLPFEALLKSGL